MPRARLTTFAVYGACLVAAGGLYALSCAPGALWQDSGLIQHRLWHGDIRGCLGLALSHPLFYIVARAGTWLPVGEFSHRVNLVSAWAGAITVANVGLLIHLWAGRVFPAVIAAVALALAHTFWWHASVAETYTLWAALFSGELLALLQYDKTRRIRYLYLLGLLNGMALAVHMLACPACLCYVTLVIGLWVKRRIRPIDVLVVAML